MGRRRKRAKVRKAKAELARVREERSRNRLLAADQVARVSRILTMPGMAVKVTVAVDRMRVRTEPTALAKHLLAAAEAEGTLALLAAQASRPPSAAGLVEALLVNDSTMKEMLDRTPRSLRLPTK